MKRLREWVPVVSWAISAFELIDRWLIARFNVSLLGTDWGIEYDYTQHRFRPWLLGSQWRYNWLQEDNDKLTKLVVELTKKCKEGKEAKSGRLMFAIYKDECHWKVEECDGQLTVFKTLSDALEFSTNLFKKEFPNNGL